MLKFIVEGRSDESMESALADAMGKAAAYISADHDVTIAILEMGMEPGRGYKAVLEVTIVPLTTRKSLHREAADLELRHMHDREYRAHRRYDENHVKQMVADHFAMTVGNFCPDIPDFYVAHMNDAALLNHLIEKEFTHAVHRKPVDVPSCDEDDNIPELRHVLGKPLKPGPGDI